MAHRSLLAASRALRSIFATSAALAVCFAFSAQALGQPKPKPPAPDGGAPPGTGTDMEVDPDAKPPEPPPKEEKPLPPQDPNAWGVGGKDEEGKFAPQKKKKVEEDQDTGPVKLGPPGAVGLDMVVGFGAMRNIQDDANTTKITALSFIVGFKYRIGESFTLKARFPATHANLTGPSQPYNTNAVGNLEIGAQYSIGLTRRLRLPVDLAFDLPTAPGDLVGGGAGSATGNVPVAQALVNQAAMFTRGWEENPLFASKRFGVRIGAGITYDRNELHVAAGTRLDIMAKTGGNVAGMDVNGNMLQVRKTTLAWVTTAQVFYDFFGGKLAPGLRAWLAYATMPVYSVSTDYSGPQFVLEPDVSGTFGLNADGSLAIRGLLGFIVPISGQLGAKSVKGQDSGRANGFRARAEFLF